MRSSQLVAVATGLALVLTASLVASSLSASAKSVPGGELLTDEQATFTGDTWWTGQGNTAVKNVSGPSVDEAGSLLIVVDRRGRYRDKTDTARVGTPQYTKALDVPSLGKYSGSVQVRAVEAPATARCELRWYSDAKGTESIIETVKGEMSSVGTDDWTTLTCASMAPDDADRVALRIFFDGVKEGDGFQADQASLQYVASVAKPEPEPTSEPTEPEPSPDPVPEPEPTEEPTTGSVTELLSSAQASFTGATWWTGQGNTSVANVSTPSADDTGALRVEVDPDGNHTDSSGTARAGTPQYGKALAVPTAGTYTGSILIRTADAPARARCELRWYAENNGIITTTTGEMSAVDAGSWTGLTCGATAPDGAARVALRVFVDGLEYGEIFYADLASLTVDSDVEGSVEPDPTPEPEPTADPDPAPTPDPTQEPAPPPVASGTFPDASTTGLSDPNAINRTLRGKVTLNAGETLENAEVVDGFIDVQGDNVTIRNVKIHGRSGSHYGINVNVDFTGVLIEDVFLAVHNFDRPVGIYGRGFTVRRAHITGARTGVQLVGSAVIEDSYIHDSWFDLDKSHGTGMSVHGGSDIVFRNNNIVFDGDRGGSSALSLYGNVAPLDNILVEGNLFNANAAYCFKGGWSEAKDFGTQITNIRVLNNHFGRSLNPDCGRSGPVSNWNGSAPGNEWSGNVWHDTGEPV